MRSRFDVWPRWCALAALFAVVGVTVLGLLTPHQKGYNDDELMSGQATYSDGKLYLDVADRVRHGDNFYAVTTQLQREHEYPVRPALTVRTPTLAFLTAAVGGEQGMRIAIGVLIAAVMVAGLWRLERLAANRWEFWSAVLLLAAGAGHVLKGELVVLHEAWAGLLIVLSLLVWRSDRFGPAVALGALAVLVREFALAYLLVMFTMALIGRARKEAWAWGTAVLACVAVLAGHVVAVAHYTGAGDPESPGWWTTGGWAFAMRTVYNTTLITPYEATAVLIPFALLGWLSMRDPIGLRVAGLSAGFLVAFTVLGRPENYYWGYVYSTPLLIGLAYAPAALIALAKRLSTSNAQVI